MTGRRTVVWLVMALTALVPLRGAHAGTDAAFDPKAQSILRKVARHYQDLDGMRFTAEFQVLRLSVSTRQELESTFAVAVQRPNKLALVQVSGALGGTIVCDGVQLAASLPVLNQYTLAPAPADMAAVLNGNELGMVGGSMSRLLLDALTASDPYVVLMDGVTNLTYLGDERVRSRTCAHLRFEQPDCDWDLWVRDGPQSWIEEVRNDVSKAVHQGQAARAPGRVTRTVVTIRYDGWSANPTLSADAFAFTPPAGAHLVKTFRRERDAEASHPLVGKPAPGFTLEGLDGSPMELATLRHKNAVILDFWATWCRPCRQSLPMLSALAEAYREKGVVFYAINQQEEAEAVRTFVDGLGLRLPVLFDKSGIVGSDYGVSSIPQTVLIGKDGIVRAVHVGADAGLEARMKVELDAILAAPGTP
ncbi:MAG: DUF2092 domain-containing protein [Lentisphaerae bacterium]|nr:DUF2092 domain-containing protein [Lentisphaerota bacterium]